MAKRKSRIKCFLISSNKRIDFLQPVINESISKIEIDVLIEFDTQFERNFIVHRQRERDFVGSIISNDLILVDLESINPSMFFEIGVARTLGKPLIFIAENSFYFEELPVFIKQNYFIVYKDKNDLVSLLNKFFIEYLDTPKRFSSRPLIESSVKETIDVDLQKLDNIEFQNLCFELLSRLGYKNLEWKIKDDFVDAVTTLRKKDPDGYEYDEFWLIVFGKESLRKSELFDILIHDPEYFLHRITDSLPVGISGRIQERGDVPLTLLFIIKDNDSLSKRNLNDVINNKYSLRHKRGPSGSVRMRIWDESFITQLVQNNSTLLRKYFSTEAFERSGVRLSYEQLYGQYAEMNNELKKTNSELQKVIKQSAVEKNRLELLERDAAWKLLSFTAAHRLSSPVDAVDAELQNLKIAIENNNRKEVYDIISSMEISIEKAKSIVAQFRNLSIAHEITPIIVNNEKLNEILKQSAKHAIDKNIKVNFNFKKIPDISIDVHKLSECFEELIRNSLHFVTDKHQHITISTELIKKSDLPEKIDKTKDYIKITFSDNGCGVPLEKKKEIFKPFERSYIHGTGLGLSFCEIIIEKHGGVIRENGKENEGAVFEIFLPIINNIEIKK